MFLALFPGFLLCEALAAQPKYTFVKNGIYYFSRSVPVDLKSITR